MVHFNKPCSLNKLQDLVQKINQHYWEQKGELLQEILLTSKQEAKIDWSDKSNPNPHQNQAGPSNSNLHLNLTPTHKGEGEAQSQYFSAKEDWLFGRTQ